MTSGDATSPAPASVRSSSPFHWPKDISQAERKSLIAGGLGWMLDAMDVMLYSFVLARLMTDFGMTKATGGLLNSLTLGASAIGGFLFGFLADGIGRTRALLGSILVYSISSAACGLSHSIPQLAIFRLLLGLGMGAEWSCGAALIAETWRAEHGGRGLSLVVGTTFYLALSPGKWLGYASFGFFGDAFGRRKPYFTYLLVAAILVPLYAVIRSPILLLLLGPFVAFFGTGFFSGYAAIASELFPGEIRAAAMGLSYNVGRGLSALAPFAVGAIATRFGFLPGFFLLAGAFLAAALLALLLPETRGRELT